MKVRIFLVVLILGMVSQVALGQDRSERRTDSKRVPSEEYVAPGEVNVIVPSAVEMLVHRYRNQNQLYPFVLGYRIHIKQSTKSGDVLAAKRRADSLFPEFESYYNYLQPYFKLRIGDFVDRNDAYRALTKVRKEFPSAFLAREQIDLY